MKGWTTGRKRWSGLALVQVLSIVLLAGCLYWVVREVEFFLANDRITSSLSLERALGATLGRQVAGFLAAALLVHVLFGFLVYGMARLTEAAFPRGTGARREWLIAGWFALLVGLLFAANTTLFPASLFAGDGSWWRGELAGLQRVAWPAVALAGLALLLAVLAMRRRLQVQLGGIPLATGVAAAVVVIALPWLPSHAGRSTGPLPNIVIVGIDSLRDDLEVPRRGPADAPNIREFIRESRRLEDTTTPLARTYASWLTILTGRHPVATNARYNLMPRALVREGETLGESLRSHGYRAIYATDEVRYANFDESFGFDTLVTPPVGGVDFLLGYAGDMPLVNVLGLTRAGGWLFPSNWANRAASVTYRPRDFLTRLERGIELDGPALLAIHLTLAHWPYSWAGKPTPKVPEAYRSAYGEAVQEVDRQFAGVMQLLDEKGVLDNAIVVLLSDHGEALGADNDSMIRQSGTSREVWDSLWGHGTSVLSPNQYRVLLAMRAFGRARLPGPEQDYDWPVSLEDLRPTLEELVTGATPADVDGISLVPYLADPSRATALASRIRFTETDFNTTNTLAGRYEASGIIDEAAVYYELDPDSGWVQLRSSKLPGLIARKQRAAIGSGSYLAAIPAPSGGIRYLFAEGPEPVQEPAQGPGQAFANPEARRLYEALKGRFPGELQGTGDLP